MRNICRFKLPVSSQAVTNIQGYSGWDPQRKPSSSNKVLSGSSKDEGGSPSRVQTPLSGAFQPCFPPGSPDPSSASSGPLNSLPTYTCEGRAGSQDALLPSWAFRWEPQPRAEKRGAGSTVSAGGRSPGASGWAKVCVLHGCRWQGGSFLKPPSLPLCTALTPKTKQCVSYEDSLIRPLGSSCHSQIAAARYAPECRLPLDPLALQPY